MEKCEKINECIACGHTGLVEVLNLGDQPLANSFLKDLNEQEDVFPLAICRCEKCFHVQLTHKVHPDLLFKDYLYVSGTAKTQLDYFDWFAEFTTERHHGTPRTVLDIGCNDGSQLNSFKKKGHFKTFGVDPAENLHPISSKNHDVVCGYFNNQTYPDFTYFDIIVCQNAFAHNYDPLQFLQNVSKVMDSGSTLYITTSQANMILNNEFDTIYHEHISFYNIKSMNELCKRAGLNLIDVVKHPIHGVSYIFVISKFKSRKAHIKNLIDMEELSGLYKPETYDEYRNECKTIIDSFYNTIDGLREFGYTIVGYGAPAKGNTLMNAAKEGPDFIIDDNPLKQGLFVPGMGIPVYGQYKLDEYSDVDSLVFVPLAWNFFEEIKKKITNRREGKTDLFLRYFPEVEIEGERPLFHHPV